MTELKQILTMVLRQGIAFKRLEKSSSIEQEQVECDWATKQTCVSIHTIIRFSAKSEGVIGYSGFDADMYFDKDGQLISIGAWE